MTNIDQLKHAINASSELSKKGESRAALELLDIAITDALGANRLNWVRILSRHGAAIADSIGDVRLFKQYSSQALACLPDDAQALYGLADALSREGKTEEAKQYAVRSYKMGIERNTPQHRALIELIQKRWPEVGKG
jgi:tetratricopeptide (TPR) repeat protein